MEDRLQLMLQMQLDLQKNHMGANPQTLTGDAMADFMRWNAFALEDEIHEAMGEVDWKPWAKPKVRGIREEAFLKEMVDAFHFFMNMLLCGFPDSPAVIADKFVKAYIAKNAVNAQRQADGYDGISTKCPNCKRELSEVEQLARFSKYIGTTRYDFCSKNCADEFHKEGDHG